MKKQGGKLKNSINEKPLKFDEKIRKKTHHSLVCKR